MGNDLDNNVGNNVGNLFKDMCGNEFVCNDLGNICCDDVGNGLATGFGKNYILCVVQILIIML